MCADGLIANLDVCLLPHFEETLDPIPVHSSARSRSACSTRHPRNGKQSDENAARHDALFEKGYTQQLRLVLLNVIHFTGNYAMQPFRERMIAAARSALFASCSKITKRAHIHSTGCLLRSSQRGCMRARSTFFALLPAASAFFKPAPAPPLPVRTASDTLSGDRGRVQLAA